MYRHGQHEAIIGQDVFDQVQAINATRVSYWQGMPTKRLFLLTGLLRCGVCGRGMYGQWNNYTRAKAQRRELTCFTYKCTARGHAAISGRILDNLVLEQLAQLPLNDASIRDVRRLLEAEHTQEPDHIRDLMQAKHQQEERRKRLTLFLADGTLAAGDYKVAMAEVEQAMATIDRELVGLQPAQSTTEMVTAAEQWLRQVGDLTAVIAAATLEERASLIAGAIKHVTFTRETGMMITWQPWAEMLRERLNLDVGKPMYKEITVS